jgi:hypothetical protein
VPAVLSEMSQLRGHVQATSTHTLPERISLDHAFSPLCQFASQTSVVGCVVAHFFPARQEAPDMSPADRREGAFCDSSSWTCRVSGKMAVACPFMAPDGQTMLGGKALRARSRLGCIKQYRLSFTVQFGPNFTAGGGSPAQNRD